MVPDTPTKALLRLCYRVFWWPVCRMKGHEWRSHNTPWRKRSDGVMYCEPISRWCVRCKERRAAQEGVCH